MLSNDETKPSVFQEKTYEAGLKFVSKKFPQYDLKAVYKFNCYYFILMIVKILVIILRFAFGFEMEFYLIIERIATVFGY